MPAPFLLPCLVLLAIFFIIFIFTPANLKPLDFRMPLSDSPREMAVPETEESDRY